MASRRTGSFRKEGEIEISNKEQTGSLLFLLTSKHMGLEEKQLSLRRRLGEQGSLGESTKEGEIIQSEMRLKRSEF